MPDDLARVFAVKRPCPNCPFALATRPFLTVARAQEIAGDCLHGDAPFHCHGTVNYSGTGLPSDGASVCAGFLLVLDQDRGLGANLHARLGLHLGLLDPTRLDREQAVYPSAEAFVDAHRRSGRCR